MLANFVYQLFLKTMALESWPLAGRFWRRAYKFSTRHLRGPVRCRLHDRKVLVNYGHHYPFFLRKFPTLNFPLIELAYQASVLRRNPLTMIDEGAS